MGLGFKAVTATALLAASFGVGANELTIEDVAMAKTEGCMEGPMAQFGRYVGDWTIEDEGLQQDGTWKAGNGARWLFTCFGNGVAVQDFWMPNGADGGSPPGVGTNLRIYDPATESWKITWTATGAPGQTLIRASEDEDGNIRMFWVSPEQSPNRRITFFAPTDAGWDWVMDMDLNGDGTWSPVYKIKATPR